jgi:hypothetical protein
MQESNNKFGGIFSSVKTVAGKVSEKAAFATDGIKNTAVQLKDNAIAKQAEHKILAAEKKRQNDLINLAPIFKEDISNNELLTERVIRIVNYDARLENDVCKGSIGFYEKTDDRKMPTLYSKFVPELGLSFYPQLSESVFIADPCIAGKYIEIDEYFNYMKQVRVNELTLVAQSLGAKSVTIRLKNTTNSKSLFSKAAQVKVGPVLDVNCEQKGNDSSKNSIEIWSQATFKTTIWNGGPTMPTLLYFRNESDISSLIQMVLVNRSKVAERTYSMKASSSSGISLNEAVSITGTLKKIKCSAGANFAKSAENENTAFLEYTIKF